MGGGLERHGGWEQLNNTGFNSPKFEGIRNEAGRNSLFLSAKKWADATSIIYASEADLLNVALFGITAVQWRSLSGLNAMQQLANPDAQKKINK